MAKKIENREKSKICISNQVATKFYKECKQLARQSGHNTKFHITELLNLRERILRNQHGDTDETGSQGMSQHDQQLDNDECSTNTSSTREHHSKRRRRRRLLRPFLRLTSWQEWLLLLGIYNDETYVDTKILELLDVAIREVDEVEGEWFYFSDFLFYNTVRSILDR